MAPKRSAAVNTMLKRTALRKVTGKVGARRRATPRAKQAAGTPLARLNQQVEKQLRSAALKAEGDAAFVLHVRTALNGDTPKVTGWQPAND